MPPEACLTAEDVADMLLLGFDWAMWILPIITIAAGYFVGFSHARARYELDLEDVG